MKFNSLKEKCEYYRSLTDYKLMPNSYVLAMVDGHCFSKLIKNKFEKPFDDEFIRMMNETAKYLCEQIQGAKFAFTQSDEISILITDFDTPVTESYFGFRLCKLQSLIAAMATAKFNQLYAIHNISVAVNEKHNTRIELNKEIPLCTFDCKVWTVPNENDAIAWFLYRQLDCIRNSKQQFCQTYMSHKELVGKDTDKQVEVCKEKTGYDWNSIEDGKKWGRLIHKVETQMEKDLPDGEHINFVRNIWMPEPMFDLRENKEKLSELLP